MKVIEMLKLVCETLKVMSKHDVMRDDWRWIPMYDEFKNMRSTGLKYKECIRMLAEDYNVSRATVERAIRRLDSEC